MNNAVQSNRRSLLLSLLGGVLVASGCVGKISDKEVEPTNTPPSTNDPTHADPVPAKPPMFVSVGQPTLGRFVSDSDLEVSGTGVYMGSADSATVNDQPMLINGSVWGALIPTDIAAPVLPIRASLYRDADGTTATDRSTVIVGESLHKAGYVSRGIAIRLRESGLKNLAPAIADIVAEHFDLNDNLPVGNLLIDECFAEGPLGYCWAGIVAKIGSPGPSYNGVDLDFDMSENILHTTIGIRNLRFSIDVHGRGLAPDCRIDLHADVASVAGSFGLKPNSNNNFLIDVTSTSAPTVEFMNFDVDFGGRCDKGLIGRVVNNRLKPLVEDLVVTNLLEHLRDPDGRGPKDNAVASAVEDALAEVSISGAAGDALQMKVEAPFFDIPVDNSGITFGSNGRIAALRKHPDAPQINKVYHVPTPFPAFGEQTPGGKNFDLAVCISPTFFNQSLAAIVDRGLLHATIADFQGKPLNGGTLAVLIPAFRQFDPDKLFVVRVQPKLSPFLTADEGPNGSLGELWIPHLQLTVTDPDNETPYATIVIDVRGALDIGVASDGTLEPQITAPTVDDIDVELTQNKIDADPQKVKVILPTLVATLLPDIAGAIRSLRIPSFFGADLVFVETAREGGFFSIYANIRVTK